MTNQTGPDSDNPDNQEKEDSGLPSDNVEMVLEPDRQENPVSPLTEEDAGYLANFEESVAVSDSDNSIDTDIDGTDGSLPRRAIERSEFTPAPNVTMTYKTSEPFKRGAPGLESSLALVTATVGELEKMGQDRPIGSLGTSEKVLQWAQSISSAGQHVLSGDAFYPATTREGSQWQQSIKSDSVELQAGRPKIGEENSSGDKLTGLAAKMRMQAILGAGTTIRVPLWHTGIWVILNTPSEGSLLELDRRIGSDKVLLGRLTNGMIFSNSSVYTTSTLINFVLSHVHDATVRFSDPVELKKLIKITDIPTLIWGIMCSVYPGGYPYQQPCTVDPSICNHIVEEMLNLHKLQWTDDRALTDFQRRMMQRRSSKFTPEELARYEEEHSYHRYATAELHPKLSMDMKVPTIEEYEQIGIQWVDDMVRAVDRSVSGNLKDDERNQYIFEQARVSYLHQYSHWVRRLTIKHETGSKVIEDRESLNETITVLVGKEQVASNYIEAIGNYINHSTISLIAIPKIDCPSCGKPMSPEAKTHPHLVPFDVMSSFFTVQSQHTSKVLARSTM